MANLTDIYDYREDKFSSWNPVMRFVMELKYRYFGYFGKFDYYKTDNPVEYWANELKRVDVTKYSDMLKYVKVVGYGNLVLFKYNSIAVYNDDSGITLTDIWSMYAGFYRECRGVVIDIYNDELVITPYEKFFNLNEIEETMYDSIIEYMNRNKLTTNDLEFTEKIDGCLICARWYNDELVVSASGSLDPKINKVISWAENYIKSNNDYLILIQGFFNSGYVNRRLTFMFECICPLEHHVVDYDERQYGLYLIGIRNTKTGETYSYTNVIGVADVWEILSTTMYKNYTLDQVISKMDDPVGSTHEGFVMNIKGENGFRVKIKYSDYVQLASIIENMSRNKIVQYVYNKELDDIKSILRTKDKFIVLDEIQRCEDVINDYSMAYDKLIVLYSSRVSDMDRNGSSIQEIMKYIQTLKPAYIRADLINIYKGLSTYMSNPYYQLIKPGSRKSNDIGYLSFDTVVERIKEVEEILRKETVNLTLERSIDHEL